MNLTFALYIASTISAQSPPITKQTVTSTGTFALVTSGAVSLGTYQAGFLYYSLELRKGPKAHRRTSLKLVTGASAGSANALISALESCRSTPRAPHESLGWQVWIPVGFEDLWSENLSQPKALLSSTAMQSAFSKVIPVLKAGLPKSCDFVAGFTTTRVTPLKVEVTSGLQVPRQEEKFVVRIQGRGLGKPAKVTNYVDPYQEAPQPLLPLRGAEDLEGALKDYQTLSQVLFASASFPLAFAPVNIPHCLSKPLSPKDDARSFRSECTSPIRNDPFIDGGVFDNNPLNLAFEIVSAGLRTSPSQEAVWRDLQKPAHLDSRPKFRNVSYGYLDPWNRAYPEPKPTEDSEAQDSISYVLNLAQSFISTARSRELYTLAEHRDLLDNRVLLSRNHLPQAGDLFYAFFGFFERDLRIFDFYLGMYDAFEFNRASQPHLPNPFNTRLDRDGWQPFFCMLSWFNPRFFSARETCESNDLYNFQILIQLALDRVYQACAKITPAQARYEGPNYHCEAAAAGKTVPTVVTRPKSRFPLNHDLSTTTGVLDRLAELQFEFKDMGLKKGESQQLRSVLRSRFADIFEDIASVRENDSIHNILAVSGSIFANSLGYESPRWMIPALIGTDTIETGIITSPIESTQHWLRLGSVFQIRNWTAFLPDEANYVALSLAIGPEFLLPQFTSGLIQPSIGTRIGYAFSSWDNFTGQKCRPSIEERSSQLCSQIFSKTYLALGIVDRIRLQLNLDLFPERQTNSNSQGLGFNQHPVQISILGGLTFF